MWPLVGYRSPNNSFTVVDFPEPFGPSKPNTSPRLTSKSTLSTARAFARPQKSLNTLVRPRTEMTVSPLLDALSVFARGVGSKIADDIDYWGLLDSLRNIS